MSGQKKIVIKHLILYEKCNTGVGSKSPQNSVLMYLNSPYVTCPLADGGRTYNTVIPLYTAPRYTANFTYRHILTKT